jgi:hypothetical protein
LARLTCWFGGSCRTGRPVCVVGRRGSRCGALGIASLESVRGPLPGERLSNRHPNVVGACWRSAQESFERVCTPNCRSSRGCSRPSRLDGFPRLMVDFGEPRPGRILNVTLRGRIRTRSTVVFSGVNSVCGAPGPAKLSTSAVLPSCAPSEKEERRSPECISRPDRGGAAMRETGRCPGAGVPGVPAGC